MGFEDLYGHDARMAAALFGENAALSMPSRTDDPKMKRAQDSRPQSPAMSNASAENLSGFISNL